MAWMRLCVIIPSLYNGICCTPCNYFHNVCPLPALSELPFAVPLLVHGWRWKERSRFWFAEINPIKPVNLFRRQEDEIIVGQARRTSLLSLSLTSFASDPWCVPRHGSFAAISSLSGATWVRYASGSRSYVIEISTHVRSASKRLAKGMVIWFLQPVKN